jgi:hypothetical protein
LGVAGGAQPRSGTGQVAKLDHRLRPQALGFGVIEPLDQGNGTARVADLEGGPGGQTQTFRRIALGNRAKPDTRCVGKPEAQQPLRNGQSGVRRHFRDDRSLGQDRLDQKIVVGRAVGGHAPQIGQDLSASAGVAEGGGRLARQCKREDHGTGDGNALGCSLRFAAQGEKGLDRIGPERIERADMGLDQSDKSGSLIAVKCNGGLGMGLRCCRVALPQVGAGVQQRDGGRIDLWRPLHRVADHPGSLGIVAGKQPLGQRRTEVSAQVCRQRQEGLQDRITIDPGTGGQPVMRQRGPKRRRTVTIQHGGKRRLRIALSVDKQGDGSEERQFGIRRAVADQLGGLPRLGPEPEIEQAPDRLSDRLRFGRVELAV